MSEQVRSIPQYSVVRAPSGEIGYLVHATDDGIPAIAVRKDLWIKVEPTTVLEVLAHPETTAQDWIHHHERKLF